MPVVIIGSDQCFPPYVLPRPSGGDCLRIVRVEDGSLDEVVSVLKDVLRNYARPAGGLPHGSLILLSSLSQLSRVGLQSYVEEL